MHKGTIVRPPCLALLSLFISLIIIAPGATVGGRAAARDDQKLKAAAEALEAGRGLLRNLEADRAFARLQTALKLYAEMGDPVGVAAARDLLGDVYAQSAQYEAAFGHYRAAVEEFRRAGDAQGANAVLAKVGERHLLLGDLEAARAAFAAMTVSPPGRALKESGVIAPGGDDKDRAAGGGAALAGLASCFRPLNFGQNADPQNPPPMGRAPKTPNGVGRMDLRVVDEAGKPVRGVRAQIQSTRPGGLYCECWDSTDQWGRALMPPLHIADRIKLVLRAPGLAQQELTLAAEALAAPVRVALTKAGARLLEQQAQARALDPAGACFDFYRALVAYAGSELGRARADLAAGKLPESRQRYEALLAELNLPGVEQFRRVATFRVAALTALGDIAFGEGRHEDSLKLYEEAVETAKKAGRLDLAWAAQRGAGRSSWRKYLSAPQDARAARLRGEALSSYLAAVRTIESLRAGSLRADESRTTFLAGTRDVYDEALEVVAETALVAAGPNAPAEASAKGVTLGGGALDLAATAVSLVEQSRARSLLDMLGETHGRIERGLPADLLKRRAEVLARQQEIARLLTGVAPPDGSPRPPAAELEKELEHLSYTYDGIENQIRAASPRYDALAGARPLTLAEIRQKVLDDKSALLFYNLGEGASYLWVVTREAVSVARLPARAEIDGRVDALRAQLIPAGLRRSVLDLTGAGDARGEAKTAEEAPAPSASARRPPKPADYARAASALYEAVLRPAAPLVAGKRLVVVPDGALSFVPFEALVTEDAPSAASYGELRYLLKEFEVAYAPSASVVGAARSQAGRAGASGPVLVLADPIFDAADARAKGGVVAASAGASSRQTTRGLKVVTAVGDVTGVGAAAAGEATLARLAGTRAEAEAISQAARAARRGADLLLDAEASEANVAGRDAAGYGVVHFATHGLLNARHPSFTGLVLTLVGEQQGDGFLRVNEVFNLKLGSPLVMLSACETGLGREKRGEGVIGLPRAFMYAGAPTVGVSLWAVSDRSTARLMSDFYEGLLAKNLRPAGALREAQLKMMGEAETSAPFFWAPFVLVGDWT